jgi:hypothetical protein
MLTCHRSYHDFRMQIGIHPKNIMPDMLSREFSPVGHSDMCYLSGIFLLSVIPDKGNRESILVAFWMDPPRTTCVDDGKG